MVEKKVFLTDERRAVLEGNYDGSASNERTHKSRIRKRTQIALAELIEVARSPVIDNSEVFDEEAVRILVNTLLHGTSGMISDDSQTMLKETDMPVAWNPEDIYSDSAYPSDLYVSIDGTLRKFHENDNE